MNTLAVGRITDDVNKAIPDANRFRVWEVFKSAANVPSSEQSQQLYNGFVLAYRWAAAQTHQLYLGASVWYRTGNTSNLGEWTKL